MKVATWLEVQIASGLLLLLSAARPALAEGQSASDNAHERGRQAFRRISTFPVYLNNPDISAETVAEIVDVSEDGKTLVYTDAAQEAIGFVDIRDPRNPAPLGILPLAGEPTSVTVAGKYALAGVNTSASFTMPSGYVAVIDIRRQVVVATLSLAGQPDSLKASADGRYCAVVIENERDEDIVVDGVEGGLPQAPAGLLQIIDLVGAPSRWRIRDVSLTGLSTYAPSDPEPEFVDVNDENQAVVTLQENNHIVVVDLPSGRVISDFDAGSVDLFGIDATEDGVISLTDSLSNIPREPDAVAWIGKKWFATANEGDLFGGSRGFSIFNRRGRLLFDSGTSFERLGVRIGHYPEDRSENKGTEPEAVEFGAFGEGRYLFVASERGSFIAVYRIRGAARPILSQVLPGNFGPEGLLAIPKRNLLVASSENDDPTFGVRASIMIYALEKGRPTYPQMISADDLTGKPIGWSALSGLTALPKSNRTLLAVWDSYYSESRIFTIDVARMPALITGAVTLTGGSGGYDPEGISVAPDGTIWIASEGNASSRRNLLLQVNASGQVLREVGLPPEIEACRAASTSRGTLGAGFEGVAVVPGGSGYLLYVAQQRGWDYTTPECEALDDDPAGTNPSEPGFTRIWVLDPVSAVWSSIAWELEPVPSVAAWVGLSEITWLEDGSLVLIERDNRTGDFGTLKTLIRVKAADLADGIVSRNEKQVFDLLPALLETNGWITDKPEGTAVTPNGLVYVVTDNDGVEDWSGETWFLRLGKVRKLFQ